MHLAAPTPPPPGQDVASTLDAAREALGDRPAVTVLRPDRREEQGVASLAQWAAKGAHLLELDLLLEPGDELCLDAPLSWTTAAVCLAAWWAGAAVRVGNGGAPRVAVVHEGRAPRDDVDEVLWLGDAVDASPLGEVAGEPWASAVQTFPDQPPRPRAGADSPALVVEGDTWTQQQLLRATADLGDGSLGIEGAPPDVVTGIVAVALRPLAVGRPTVLLDGVDRAAAAGEKVARWL